MYFEGDKVVLVYDIYIPCLPVFCMICVYLSVKHMYTMLTSFLYMCIPSLQVFCMTYAYQAYQISAWYMCIDSFLSDFCMIYVYRFILTRFLHDMCIPSLPVFCMTYVYQAYQISAWYMCIDSFLSDFCMIYVYRFILTRFLHDMCIPSLPVFCPLVDDSRHLQERTWPSPA